MGAEAGGIIGIDALEALVTRKFPMVFEEVRADGDSSFTACLCATEDLLRNIHGVAPVAELDGGEIGYLVGKVAEIKRQAR